MNRERAELKRNRMHGGKLRAAAAEMEIEIRRSVRIRGHQRMGALRNCGRHRRQDDRAATAAIAGTLRDQIAPGLAFLRATIATSARRFSKIPRFSCGAHAGEFGERADALGALRRAAICQTPASVFSICARSASDRVLSVFCFSSGVSSKNWLNPSAILVLFGSDSAFQARARHPAACARHFPAGCCSKSTCEK